MNKSKMFKIEKYKKKSIHLLSDKVTGFYDFLFPKTKRNFEIYHFPRVLKMSNEGTINPEVRFDTDYLKTIHGKINVAVIVLGIICLIITTNAWGGGFLYTAIAFGLFKSITSLVFYLMHIPEKFYSVSWLPFEIAAICIVAIFYFIGSLMIILVAHAVNTVAGIFGFITTAVYGYAGYLKYQSWKNGELAQGSLRGSSTTNNFSTSTPSAFPA